MVAENDNSWSGGQSNRHPRRINPERLNAAMSTPAQAEFQGGFFVGCHFAYGSRALTAGQKAVQLGAKHSPAAADFLSPDPAAGHELEEGGSGDAQIPACFESIEHRMAFEPARGIDPSSTAVAASFDVCCFCRTALSATGLLSRHFSSQVHFDAPSRLSTSIIGPNPPVLYPGSTAARKSGRAFPPGRDLETTDNSRFSPPANRP